ncbi:Small-conductance mechanosensitive channel [Pontiella desulfatans]|uniref:Small-conductance mechanosensitive channel n=1 Tax=Pontiella desulfatans TaxID=2750659 RepID=A0A6C2U6V6_PONDE|nr:mechanosensitive ion channel domain-containing protein [Pontiella desulfatans]VGO15261.1 Small-conductance mechanosensitive channel [Pontiella desulfatans]
MNTNAVIIAETSADATPIAEQVTGIAIEWGLKIVSFLLVLLIGMWIAKAIKKGFTRVMEKKGVDVTLTKFLTSLLYVGLQAFVIVAALEKLNVKTASFIAILGAAGLAVGLALQGSLANFASGVLMIIFKPFAIGDFIEAGGAMGGVKEIGIFTTTVDSPDNKLMIVPNAQIMGGKITNFNANGTRRVDLVAGIGYGDDIDKAKSVIEGILAADKRILKEPAPTVAVVEMADSSVNIVVRPWCSGADYWGVYFDTTETIKKTFDEQGITIPFPQRDVHIYEHKEG